MKRFVFVFCTILLHLQFSLFAQEVQFGRVTARDLAPKVYPLDSAAEAVILHDYGQTYFSYQENTGIIINTQYHVVKRILSENATELGIVNIVYQQPEYQRGESVNFFQGRTYWLEDGHFNFKEVADKDIFDTKMGTSFYNKKITFPNVTADCIIEYTYTVSTPMTIRDKPRPWYFQGRYPVLCSEYSIGFPSFLGYHLLITGYLPIEAKAVERRNINLGHSQLDGMGSFYQYSLANIPAFKDEPYISARDNFISKISFELIEARVPGSNVREFSTTWKAINSTLISSEYFGRAILRKTGFLKEEVNRFGGIKDPKERLKAAYQEWNGRFKIDDHQSSVFIRNEQKKVLDNKAGTPNQVNGLFISLLRELDLEANPVILSRRSNGSVNREFPLLDSFDYIIAKVTVGDEVYLVDITDKNFPLGVLPFECLNMLGYEVKQGGGEFVEIAPKAKYWETAAFTSEIDPRNGRISGKADRNYLGYSGIEVRRKAAAQGSNFQAEFMKRLGNYTISELDIRNLENNEMPLSAKYLYSHEEEEIEDPDFIYFNPMLSEQLEKNPFTLEERLYPVDFGWPYEDIFSHTVKIPEGYEIESLPKSEGFSLSDNSARYTYQSSVNREQGTVTVLARMYIRNPVYYAAAYHDLKELFSYRVRKSNEQIVFKKK